MERNELGRFAAAAKSSSPARNERGRFAAATKQSTNAPLRMKSPKEYSEVAKMIRQGPMTVILVFSPSCPHCHTYMPLWDELCATKGRKANMISMEASTYQETPLSEKKRVSAVPTVLFVNKEGEITEPSEPRNIESMTKAISSPMASSSEEMSTESETSSPMSSPSPKTLKLSENLFRVTSPPKARVATPYPLSGAVIPGTTVEENPLTEIPGTPVAMSQRGGNPWAAFLLAARQAAPAAALLGAYGALPKRSSGLTAARRHHKRHKRRMTRRLKNKQHK